MLAGLDAQVRAAQHRGGAVVGEVDAAELHGSGLGQDRGGRGALRLDHDGLLGGEALDLAGGRHAAHADVEELADAVEGVEHDRGEQHQGQGAPGAHGPRAGADEGQRDRAGGHAQREHGVDDQQDELVARQVAHDLGAHFLGRLGEALAHGPPGVHEDQGAQALDRVELLGRQGARGPPVAGGHGFEGLAEPQDAGGHQRDRDGEEARAHRVDHGAHEEDDDERHRQGGDHGGEEGPLVGGDPLDAVGRRVDDAPGALAGALRGAEGEHVGDEAVARLGLQARHLAPPDRAGQPRGPRGGGDPRQGDPPGAPRAPAQGVVDPPSDGEVAEREGERSRPR